MPVPEKFIANSDYPTLRNDDGDTATVIVPSSIVVAAGTTTTLSTILTVGSSLAESRVRISSSKIDAARFYAGFLGVNRTGSQGGYTIFAFTSRISPTEVKFSVAVPNQHGASMTGASGAETFTFKISTFISPFN